MVFIKSRNQTWFKSILINFRSTTTAVSHSAMRQPMAPSRKKPVAQIVLSVANTATSILTAIRGSSLMSPETHAILTNLMKRNPNHTRRIPEKGTMEFPIILPEPLSELQHHVHKQPTSKTTSGMLMKMKLKRNLFSISDRELFNARSSDVLRFSNSTSLSLLAPSHLRQPEHSHQLRHLDHNFFK